MLTHVHADHAGCARWLQTQGAKVIIGAGDVATAGRGTNDPLTPTASVALSGRSSCFRSTRSRPTSRSIARWIWRVRLPELRVVPVAGHTPGSPPITGDEAFVGDMIKGGELFTHSPTEHLYQTDRIADHRALAGVLDRGAKRSTSGTAGRSTPAMSRRGSPTPTTPAATPRCRRSGRAASCTGAAPRRSPLPAASPPAARALRDRPHGRVHARRRSAAVTSTAACAKPTRIRCLRCAPTPARCCRYRRCGRRRRAEHREPRVVELAGELPAGPVHLLARTSAGWKLGGPSYTNAHVSDELSAGIGVRPAGPAMGRLPRGQGPVPRDHVPRPRRQRALRHRARHRSVCGSLTRRAAAHGAGSTPIWGNRTHRGPAMW